MDKLIFNILNAEFKTFLKENVLNKIEIDLPQNSLFYIISGSSISNAIYSFLFNKPLFYNDIDVFVFMKYDPVNANKSIIFDGYRSFNCEIINQYYDKNINYILLSTDRTDVPTIIDNKNNILQTLSDDLSKCLNLDDFANFDQNEYNLTKRLLDPGFHDFQVNQDLKEFLLSIDLNCCQAGYSPLTDKVFISESFKKFIEDKSHLITIENGSFILRSIARAAAKVQQYPEWKFNIRLHIEALSYSAINQKLNPLTAKYAETLTTIPHISSLLTFTKNNNQYIPVYNNQSNLSIMKFQNIKQSRKQIDPFLLYQFNCKILKYKKSQQEILIQLIQNYILDFDIFFNMDTKIKFKNFNYISFLKYKTFFQRHSFFSTQIDFNRINDYYNFISNIQKEDNIFIGFVETFFAKKDGYMNPNDEFSFFSDNNYFRDTDKLDFNQIKNIFNEYEKINDKELIAKIILPNQFVTNLVELTTISQLKKEGSNLKHCVGGYGIKLSSKKSRIFSIQIDQELATMETDFNVTEIIQLKGYSNQTPSKKIIELANDFIFKMDLLRANPS